MIGEFFASILTLSLFGSFIWAALLILIFTIALFTAEVNENGWVATVFTIATMGIFFIWGRDSLDMILSLFTWLHILSYFVLGLIHAFIRVFFYGRNEMIKVNKTINRNKYSRHELNREIKDNVFRWWFLWPVSLLVWIIQDIVKDVYNYCYQKLEKLFNSVFEWGVKSVPEIKPDIEETESENPVGFNEYN